MPVLQMGRRRLREIERSSGPTGGRGGIRAPSTRLMARSLPVLCLGGLRSLNGMPTLECTTVPSLMGGGIGTSRRAKNSGFGFYDLTFLHVMHSQAHLLIHSLSLSGPVLCGLVSQLGVSEP